jgi:hypothetical protein
VVLEGAASDNTTIAAFLKQLQAPWHFHEVNLVLSRQEQGQKTFSITCKIKLAS